MLLSTRALSAHTGKREACVLTVGEGFPLITVCAKNAGEKRIIKIPYIPEIPTIPNTTLNEPLCDESSDSFYVIECPCCGGNIQIRSEDLEKGNMVCPYCNKLLEIDFE